MPVEALPQSGTAARRLTGRDAGPGGWPAAIRRLTDNPSADGFDSLATVLAIFQHPASLFIRANRATCGEMQESLG